MKNKDDIQTVLAVFQEQADKPIRFDEEAILAAYSQDKQNQSLPIKILSIFGGILASLAFLGFLFISQVTNSDAGLIVFGAIFITSSIWLSKVYDKIIIDTLSVSCFIIGFFLIGFGCSQANIDENIISVAFIVIALITLSIVDDYMLSFVSILIINGSILTLIMSNKVFNSIHMYVTTLALATTYFFLKEASILVRRKKLSKIYEPVRIALIFSFLSGLLILGKRGILPVSSDFIWVSSVVIIATIVYLISILFGVLHIKENRVKIAIYVVSLLALLSTALAPAISGAMLIILLSFTVNYKTGFVIGIIAFIYFIGQYYYDLNYTLLTKSILLFSTGVFFMILYFFTHKHLTTNEKV